MSKRRKATASAREVAALRETYCQLYERIRLSSQMAMLPIDALRAPLPYSLMMRLIAKDQGLSTLGDLLEKASRDGVVEYDLSRGRTLRKVAEWVLAGMPGPKGTPHLSPASGETRDRRRLTGAISEALPPEDRRLVDEIGTVLVGGEFSRPAHQGWEQFRVSLETPFERLQLPFGIGHGDVVRMASRSIRSLAVVCKGETASFVDDFSSYCDHLGERDQKIVLGRLGLFHPHPITLEDVGASVGITRERARQIESRFRKRAAAWKPPLAILAVTAWVGRSCGRIISAHEWFEALPPSLRPPHLYQMKALQAAVEFGWIDGLVAIPGEGLWLNSEEATLIGADLGQQIGAVRRAVNKQLQRWGAVGLELMATACGEDGPGLAHALLSRRFPCPIVGRWLVPSRPRRSALRDRIGKVLRVTPTVDLWALRRAVARSLRDCPPDEVLVALLRRDLAVEINETRGTVTAQPGADLPEISGSEKLAVELIDECGGVISLRELQRGFVRNGYSAPMAAILGGRSSILARPAPSILAIVGHPVPTEKVQAAVRQLAEEASDALLGYRNLTHGQLQVSYRIDPELLSSISFKRPTQKLSEGDYRVSGHDGRCIQVRKGYLTGVRRLARSVLSKGATILNLTFDLEGRTVSLSAS